MLVECRTTVPWKKIRNALTDGESVITRCARKPTLDNIFIVGLIDGKFQWSLRTRTDEYLYQALIQLTALFTRNSDWRRFFNVLPAGLHFHYVLISGKRCNCALCSGCDCLLQFGAVR